MLLIDEAYADFAERNCVSLVRDFDNVIVLRSLSKGYSLAGLRFGYAIAPKDLNDGLIKVKDSYNVDALAIALATAAIQDQVYFRQNVETIKKDRTALTSNCVSQIYRSRQSFEFRFCPSGGEGCFATGRTHPGAVGPAEHLRAILECPRNSGQAAHQRRHQGTKREVDCCPERDLIGR